MNTYLSFHGNGRLFEGWSQNCRRFCEAIFSSLPQISKILEATLWTPSIPNSKHTLPYLRTSPAKAHPLPLDDSIYVLSCCVRFVPTSVFKFIRLHPNPEAFHDIRRCTVELLPIAHVTPDQNKHKHKYKYRYKHKYTNKIRTRLQRIWVVHKDLRAQLHLL